MSVLTVVAQAKASGPYLGSNLEQIDATALHVVGVTVRGITAEGNPAKYRYVKFVDAITYVRGNSVCQASATSFDVTNDRAGGSGLAGQFPVGMVHHSVTVPTQNSWGWVQISGIALFQAGSAAVIAGDPLKPDATSDGLSDEATSGTDENLVGVAIATVADNATGLCQLMIRGAD